MTSDLVSKIELADYCRSEGSMRDSVDTEQRAKSFERKILPASDCSPRIIARFLPSAMIPKDREGGGYLRS